MPAGAAATPVRLKQVRLKQVRLKPVRLKLSNKPKDSLTLQCGYTVRRNKRDVPARERQQALRTCLQAGRFTYRHLFGRLNVLRIFNKRLHPSLHKMYDADISATRKFVERARARNPALFKTASERAKQQKRKPTRKTKKTKTKKRKMGRSEIQQRP